jgi:hypothetical protein
MVQGASKVQCEEIPNDCSLVEVTDEFVKAVADATAATGKVGGGCLPRFHDGDMRTSVEGARARHFYS